MKKELSPKEREAIAYIYDLPQYRVFKKFIENERFNIATKLVTIDPREITEIARLQGQAFALKMLHQKIREYNKQQSKVEG